MGLSKFRDFPQFVQVWATPVFTILSPVLLWIFAWCFVCVSLLPSPLFPSAIIPIDKNFHLASEQPPSRDSWMIVDTQIHPQAWELISLSISANRDETIWFRFSPHLRSCHEKNCIKSTSEPILSPNSAASRVQNHPLHRQTTPTSTLPVVMRAVRL